MIVQDLSNSLAAQLEELADQGLLRQLRVTSSAGARTHLDGREYLNFSSNDYLGLAGDEAIHMGGLTTARAFGSSAASSRLMSGNFNC